MNKQLQTLFKEFEGIIGSNELTHTESKEYPGAIEFNAKSYGRNELRIKQRQQLQQLKSKYIKDKNVKQIN